MKERMKNNHQHRHRNQRGRILLVDPLLVRSVGQRDGLRATPILPLRRDTVIHPSYIGTFAGHVMGTAISVPSDVGVLHALAVLQNLELL